MQFKPPKNSDKYQWTNHVKDKMLYYGISESLIKRIVRFPKRKEKGIASNTIAVMQPTSSKKQEIWVMYQTIESKILGMRAERLKKEENAAYFQLSTASSSLPKIRIISAWRYPGVSPVNKPIPIPDEILSAVAEICENDLVN